MRAAAIALALLVAPAMADERDPNAYASPEEVERFRICRAAVYYHLDGSEDPESRVPRPVARTMLDQINLIMAEAVLARPVYDVDDGQALIEFTESFFLGFNRTIARERERMLDPAERDAVLLDCIPWIWITARTFVDELMRFRQELTPGPAPMTPEEEQERLDDVGRRLGVRE
jgi:hypothetical protein